MGGLRSRRRQAVLRLYEEAGRAALQRELQYHYEQEDMTMLYAHKFFKTEKAAQDFQKKHGGALYA